jgi:hypothetical protein
VVVVMFKVLIIFSKRMRSRRWFPAKFSGQLNLENLTKLHIPNRDPQAYISMDLVSLFLLRQGYL